MLNSPFLHRSQTVTLPASLQQLERYTSAQATGGTSWRGPPGMHGRGPGGPSEARERQWGGRGPHPSHAQANAGPVDIPSEQSSKATEG